MKNENEHKKKRRRESDDDNTKLEGRTAAGPSVSPKKPKTEEPQVKRAEDGSPDEKKVRAESFNARQENNKAIFSFLFLLAGRAKLIVF